MTSPAPTDAIRDGSLGGVSGRTMGDAKLSGAVKSDEPAREDVFKGSDEGGRRRRRWSPPTVRGTWRIWWGEDWGLQGGERAREMGMHVARADGNVDVDGGGRGVLGEAVVDMANESG